MGNQMPGSPRGLGGAFIICLVFILYLSSTKWDSVCMPRVPTHCNNHDDDCYNLQLISK